VSGDPFEDPPRQGPSTGGADETFHVDLAGFEGPLDLLLALARQEKIDLSRIAILPLAEQYLDFVQRAEALRIEVAADFLVMAAWLAWLKSRLIAPEDAAEEETGEALADALALRLRRLEAMRGAAEALWRRPQVGRDVFARGAPEGSSVRTSVEWNASLYDLLAAYGTIRQKEIVRTMTMEKRPVFSLVDARRIMERLVGRDAGWMPLEALVAAMPAGGDRRAVTASTFGAALEMAREGAIAIRQSGPFAPIYMRAGHEHTDG